MALNFPIPNINALVVTDKGQFTEYWKQFFSTLTTYMRAYLTGKGVVPPTFTATEIAAMTELEVPTILWNSTASSLQLWNGTAWKTFTLV